MIWYIVAIFLINLVILKIFGHIFLSWLIKHGQSIVIDDEQLFNFICKKILYSDRGFGKFNNVIGLKINNDGNLNEVHFNNYLEGIIGFEFNKFFVYGYSLINIEIDIYDKKIIFYVVSTNRIDVLYFIDNFLREKFGVDFKDLQYVHKYAFILNIGEMIQHPPCKLWIDSKLEYGDMMDSSIFFDRKLDICDHLDKSRVNKDIKEWNWINNVSILNVKCDSYTEILEKQIISDDKQKEFLLQQSLFSKLFADHAYSFSRTYGEYCYHYYFTEDSALYAVVFFDNRTFIFMLAMKELAYDYCFDKIQKFHNYSTKIRLSGANHLSYRYYATRRMLFMEDGKWPKIFLSDVMEETLETNIQSINFMNFCSYFRDCNTYMSVYGNDNFNKKNFAYSVAKKIGVHLYCIDILKLSCLSRKNVIRHIHKFVSLFCSNKNAMDKFRKCVLIENIDSIKKKSIFRSSLDTLDLYLSNAIIVFTSDKKMDSEFDRKINYFYHFTYCDKNQIIKITNYAIKKYIKYVKKIYNMDLNTQEYNESMIANINLFTDAISVVNKKILPTDIFKYIIKNISQVKFLHLENFFI